MKNVIEKKIKALQKTKSRIKIVSKKVMENKNL